MNENSRYLWVKDIPGLPRMTQEALKLLGTHEAPGTVNNPTILGWADEIGGEVEDVYKADSIPWCGLFMGVVAQRAGKTLPRHPLWALSWASFGEPVDAPALGDVLVFTRNGGGHVALYVAEDDLAYHCLGGNQGDAVSIVRIAKSRLYTARRPQWRSSPPAGRKPYRVAADGALSRNEA